MFVQQNIVFVLALSFEKSRGILLMLVQYYLDDDFRFRKNHHLIRMEDRIFAFAFCIIRSRFFPNKNR